jgi:manganese oxidase
MNPRRSFFRTVFGLGASAVALAQEAQYNSSVSVPVLTPDVADLPFAIDNGVKVFHLTAEPVKQTIVPGRTLDLWGFNGSAPGPTIQANEGDRVRIIFDNHLPEPTGIHWHGLELPIEMDGVPGVGQKPVMPRERFIYEFSLHQNGTFFYHPHMAMQEMVGMLGGFIIHPKTPYAPRADKDYLIALQEYAVLPNNTIPNSMNMEFNWLTFNGKAGPASTPLIIRHEERVRIRIINLGMDHHPIHLHGFTFWETGREGARQPEAIWPRGSTTLVGVAQARDIEFVADRIGDWMLHCHLPHHMMNQMASIVGPMTRLQHAMNMPELPKKVDQVPLFPQDAFMEGPMMAMDKEVGKPETYGLPAGWSGFTGGMMTLVRVLPPEQYQKVMDLKARQQ